MEWSLTLIMHWPHDRFAVGVECLRPTEEVPVTTIQVFLFVLTLQINLEDK